MKNKRILLIACLCLYSFIVGCGEKKVDAKDVSVNPEEYAGKTITSDIRYAAFLQKDVMGCKAPDTDSFIFCLKIPNDEMINKIRKSIQAVGEYGYFVITYKVYEEIPKDTYTTPIGVIIDVEMDE